MNNQKGFSILEVMVAVSLFSLCVTSLAASCFRFMGMNTKMEQKIVAQSVAQELLEGYRQGDPAALPSSGTTSLDITRGSRTFQTTTQYCANAAYCTSSARQLTVTVNYKGAQMVSLTTVFTALR